MKTSIRGGRAEAGGVARASSHLSLLVWRAMLLLRLIEQLLLSLQIQFR